jgi:site-specific recombinase XerD
MILNNQHRKDFETYLINLKLDKELTIKRYISYYNTFLEMFAGHFNQRTCDSFLKNKSAPLPKSMIKHLLDFLKREENLSIDEQREINRINVLKQTGKVKKNVIKILTKDELNKLLKETQLSNSYETAIFRLKICFQFSGGMRITELHHLKYKDLNIDSLDESQINHKINIRPETSKGKKGAIVYIQTKYILHYLKFLNSLNEKTRKQIINNEVTIWNNTTREHYSRNFYRQTRKILGKENFTSHSLRHLRCTDLLISGFSLKETSKFMRHENEETTLIYYHLIKEDISEALEKLDKKIIGEKING